MKLREIAQAANVSLTTVSLVLNGKAGVGAEKRTLIRRLLSENGYPLHDEGGERAVRSIRFVKYSRHSYLVNGNPGFVTRIMDAAERECRRLGYDLLITATDDLGSLDLTELTAPSSVRGVLLLGTELEAAQLDVFSGVTRPLVVVDNALPLSPVSTVTMDNRGSVFAVVEHMLRLGHRRIGFLYNALPSGNDVQRKQAFMDALAFFGHAFEPELVFPLFPTMDGARRSAGELLEKGVRFPSALVGNNDSIAIGAMRALQDAGLRVPEDISVSGFDGLDFSALSEPPLTTVSVSCREMGAWAVRLLHERIRGRSEADCKLLVGTRLLERSSTAPRGAPRPHPALLPDG